MIGRDDHGACGSSGRRRFLAAVGSLCVTGLAGCGGDGDGSPTSTGTAALTPAGADPTTTRPTTADGSTPTTTPEPETFYAVSDQQSWEVAGGATEGVSVEDGVLSGDGDGGTFTSIEFTGARTRNLRLRVHETPLWDSWSYRGRLREFTDGQARGTNDTVMFVDMDEEYPYTLSTLDVGASPTAHYWWRSRDFESWEEICVYDEHPTDDWGAGTNYQFGRVAPDGTYRIYGSYNDDVTDLWTGPDVCSLERVGEVHPNPDCGGFYEPDTDTWHLYYEAEGRIPYDGGPTANALGHSTSTNGLDGWEDQGKIVDLSDFDEHTGDPEVIQIGDTYFMFIDWTADHPDYRQAVMTSSDLYDWELHGQITFEMGGDFTVRYIPDREDFLALAEFAPDGGVSVFTSPGPVSGDLGATLNVDTTDNGSYDTVVEARRNVTYGIGEDMSQITATASPTSYTWTADFDTEVPPGQPYTVTIELNHPGTRIDGFELVDAG